MLLTNYNVASCALQGKQVAKIALIQVCWFTHKQCRCWSLVTCLMECKEFVTKLRRQSTTIKQSNVALVELKEEQVADGCEEHDTVTIVTDNATRFVFPSFVDVIEHGSSYIARPAI